MTNVTQFTSGQIVNQPNGQRRAIITATGLPVGKYFVAAYMLTSNPQRFECGVTRNLANNGIVRYITPSASPDGITFTGLFEQVQAGDNAILYCNGLTQDWSMSNIEINFIPVNNVTNGVEG